MVSKKKTANTIATPTADLKAIVAATLAGNFVYHTAEAAAPLLSQGLVEQNPAMVDAATNGLATRATQKGIDSMTTTNQTGNGSGEAQVSAETQSEFEIKIEDNVPLPPVTGRGRGPGTSVYPFDRLNVGQSFFVNKPAKNLASTVSSANARWSEEIPGQTKPSRKDPNVQVPATRQLRQFVVRTVKENGVTGSRVWRTV